MQQVKGCSKGGRGGGDATALPKALYVQLSAEVAFFAEALRNWFHSVDAALVETLEADLVGAMQPAGTSAATDPAEGSTAPVAARAEAAARAEEAAAVQAAKEAVLVGAHRRTNVYRLALATCP